MTHTPGPWEFVVDDDGFDWAVAITIRMGSNLGGRNGYEPQHHIVYEVPDPEPYPEQFEEAEANARLIAAAPDLLQALNELVDATKRNDNPRDQGVSGHDSVMDRARAVIAKAEGH